MPSATTDYGARGGYVTPESSTHGSSAQHVRGFKQGLTSGDVETCDTFNLEADAL